MTFTFLQRHSNREHNSALRLYFIGVSTYYFLAILFLLFLYRFYLYSFLLSTIPCISILLLSVIFASRQTHLSIHIIIHFFIFILCILYPGRNKPLPSLSRGFPASTIIKYTTLQDPRHSITTRLLPPPATATSCSISVFLAYPYYGSSLLLFNLNNTLFYDVHLEFNNPVSFALSYPCDTFSNMPQLFFSIHQPTTDPSLKLAVISKSNTLMRSYTLPSSEYVFDTQHFTGLPDPNNGKMSPGALLIRHVFS